MNSTSGDGDNDLNSMHGKDHNRMSDTIQDLQVIQSFYNLFSTKLMNAKLDENVRGKEYTSEANILRQINGPGVIWGLGAGLISFAFLRRGPVIIMKQLHRRKNRGAGGLGGSTSHNGYTFNSETVNNPFKKSGGKASFPESTPEPKFHRRGGIFGVIGFALDATLSLFVAANVSWMMTEKEKVKSVLADIPLVEGRSFVSEELCIDSIASFNKYPKEFWLKERNPDDYNTTTLNLLKTFVENCEKRLLYERELKKEQGVSPSDSISIPSPGVPRDYTYDIPHLGQYVDEREEENYQSKDRLFESQPSIEKWESFNQFDNEEKE